MSGVNNISKFEATGWYFFSSQKFFLISWEKFYTISLYFYKEITDDKALHQLYNI